LIHFYKRFPLKVLKSCSLEVVDGYFNTDMSSDSRQIVSTNSNMDNTSDFEVEYPGTSSWHSESGISERSPLFGEHGSRGGSPIQKRVPKDNFKVVWIVFYMLGMTTLLPWNFFIAVNDYWNYKFRDVENNSTAHTKLQKEFTSYLAIASNIPNATFVILNVLFGHKFKLNLRLIGALSLMATLFVGVLIMTRIDSDEYQQWFLGSTLVLVVFLNICTAIFQGGLIGVAGKFPPDYMGGMMAGQALGGIFPALVNIIVIALDVTPINLGFYCFLVAFIFVVLSLVAYCAIQTTNFFMYYAGTGDNVETDQTGRAMGIADYKKILSKSWKYILSVFFIFFTSLSVFPSVIVLITSQFSNNPDDVWANIYFTPVTCFLLFNTGDYVGRILASWIRFPGEGHCGQNVTLALSICRLVFIPLFMLCNAAPTVRDLPVVFKTDADFYALMVIFSISNGYLGNLCMMLGPKTSPDAEEQEKIASLLVAVLVIGIGLGSTISYPIVNLL